AGGKKGELYVGMAKNLKWRVSEHKKTLFVTDLQKNIKLRSWSIMNNVRVRNQRYCERNN
ncbi:MAG: GIY-YIG nuclease family protein, partial [Planctomycetota bacterium]